MKFSFHISLFTLLLSVSLLFLLVSCDETFQPSGDEKVLEFSKDTLTFDTVFTETGSATAKILVYNHHNQSVNINAIELAGNSQSPFRINVDGTISTDGKFENVTIRPNDSLYIFIEVSIDPHNPNAPVLYQDSLVFVTGGAKQRILLEAWGQQVERMNNKLILNDTALNAVKPYLITGYLAVDSGKTLAIPAGCKLYFHNNANLIVYGNLKVEGTFTDKVEMRGDRLDKIGFVDPVPYNNVAGQWGGVYLLSKEGKHSLKYLNLTSGYVGLYFYNSNRLYRPTLDVQNCRIHNFLLYNLVAVNGDVTVINSEITNSGSYTVYLNGGKHTFLHCTIANYYSFNPASPNNRDRNPAVMIMDLNKSLPMAPVFRNCIITGSNENELTIASKFLSAFQGDFSNCYIRRTKAYSNDIFKDNRWYNYRDSVFENIRYDVEKKKYFDFMPDSISPARGIAEINLSGQYPEDLNGRSRFTDGNPDAGAYEWYPVVAR